MIHDHDEMANFNDEKKNKLMVIYEPSSSSTSYEMKPEGSKY